MLSRENYIKESLGLNLFFLRIMKEHSIFIKANLPSKNISFINQAEVFKNEFTKLLSSAVTLSNGIVPANLLSANEIVTKYTMNAEKATEFYTGIFIDRSITAREIALIPGGMAIKNITALTNNVNLLNNYALRAVTALLNFKRRLRSSVFTCGLFMTVYPSLISHIIEEAEMYIDLLTKLQKGEEIYLKENIPNNETFWNEIMKDHSYTIRGMLDPTEEELINIANNFGKAFEELKKESSSISASSPALPGLTSKTLDETIKLSDFKAQGTEGILACKIKSIILPLLADHVLREANHYIRLLRFFNTL